MSIQSFGSTEDMVAAIARNREHAKAGLHPLQAAITYGDHWVQFYDIDKRIIIFGRVPTLEQIALQQLTDGCDWDTTLSIIVGTDDSQHNASVLYSEVFSIDDETGSMAHEHKAHVWPIEKRLFDMAKAVEWKIENLDEAGRVLLDIAFVGMRAHVRSKV